MLDFLTSEWFITLAINAAKIIGLIFLVIMPMVAYSVWAERRFGAVLQDRVGPNRVGVPFTKIGLFGLGQPIADGLKSFLKEDFTPNHVNKFYYWLAPALVLIPSLMTCAVLPFGNEIKVPGLDEPVKLVIADLNIGPLFVFAIASLSVYGIALAGWSSNSKYPFLGGIRATSQMISYEIALGLSVIPILMMFGELNLSAIVQDQSKNGWALLPFSFHGDTEGVDWMRVLLFVPFGISFLIFTTSIFAETNRLPFDLPECETELVAGYHTEYSSMKFALFFMGEYAAMIIGSGLIVTLFLGGWSLPLGLDQPFLNADGSSPWLLCLIQIFVFFAKIVAFMLFFIWVRWTLPRFRYDQLMKLGWIFFFEIAIVNIFITAGIMILAKKFGS